MQLFYCDNIQEGTGALSSEEAAHCFKVLRKKVGDHVHVLDGQGGEYEVEILAIDKRSLDFQVVNHKHHEFNGSQIHLAIAPTKNMARIEWVVEKATELGVKEISLLLCGHSERKVVKLDRLHKILLGAAKQSLNFNPPVLNELRDFKSFIVEAEAELKMIAYCEGERPHILNKVDKEGSVLLLIGPEGDFSEEEVAMAINNNYQKVSLGESRLRTETAALTGLIQIQSKLSL